MKRLIIHCSNYFAKTRFGGAFLGILGGCVDTTDPSTTRPCNMLYSQSLRFLFALTLFTVCLGSPRESRAALMISFTGSTGNVNADAGFQLAANFIQSKFSDNINVSIQRGFASLGAGVLGTAGSAIASIPYANFRSAVTADSLSASDAVYAGSLPIGSFSVYTNRTTNNGNSAVPYLDTTGPNTTNVDMTTANAKALGISSFPGPDAQITFSSNFTWDFDNSDGITPGSQDFVGVAIHELMHAMGFVSGVDDLDFGGGTSPDDDYRASPLDFTRHSVASFAAGATIDFTADSRAKYFSLNGGVTNLTPAVAGGFATGVNFGDTRQASHWKDNLGWGIMDPTAVPAGQLNIVTALDLQALDVIGWNLIPVPEPTSLVLVCLPFAIAGVLRRGRTSV